MGAASEYNGLSFARRSKHWQPVIESLLGGPRIVALRRLNKRDVFVRFPPDPRFNRRYKKMLWLPKLYVCLRAPFYWPVICRFIERFDRARFYWRFYMSSSGYDLPEKILLYMTSVQQLRKIITIVRGLVKGCSFYELEDAASTSAMGLEDTRSGGLYVNSDPMFIKGTSWRSYRRTCCRWAKRSERRLRALPEGRVGWFKRMNISLRHSGPVSLNPNPIGMPYIRRYWDLMSGSK